MMRLILTLLLCVLSTSAYSEIFSGNKFHEACTTRSRVPVVTYVTGVVDKGTYDRDMAAGMQAGFADKEKSPEIKKRISDVLSLMIDAAKPYCMPAAVTTTQAADVFCKYLASNPAKRHESAASLVDEALIEAFPCRVRGGAN